MLRQREREVAINTTKDASVEKKIVVEVVQKIVEVQIFKKETDIWSKGVEHDLRSHSKMTSSGGGGREVRQIGD